MIKLLLIPLLCYLVYSIIKEYKERKRQVRFNQETSKYFKGEYHE